MDVLLKILKVSALLLFIFVLVVLCAPTLKGPFVIIHFATTLKAWLLVQLVFLGLALAAHLPFSVVPFPSQFRDPNLAALVSRFTPVTEPLRC
jgi:hypothetical protein